jgi:hypothetical protein
LLTALARAARLLLLLLAGLLLPTALLLATLVARLIALLLLAGILVGILVLTHSISFQRWSFDAPRPNVDTTRRCHIWFRMGLFRYHWNQHAKLGVPPSTNNTMTEGHIMGRYLLLWLLGIPLPILLLIWVFGGLH